MRRANAVITLSEASRTLLIAGVGLLGPLIGIAVRAARIPVSSPERLVSELRLAQYAGLVLTFSAASWVGLAVAAQHTRGVALDILLAVVFLAVAAAALVRDPRESLTLVAAAFGAHALVDILHRPGWLPSEIVPPWFVVGCAVFDAIAGAACYVPMLRRR